MVQESFTALRKTGLAQCLNVSVRTIDNWKAQGIIPYVKIGRVVLFNLREVEAALKRFSCDCVGGAK